MGKPRSLTFDADRWLTDNELRSVSSGARGMWIDMLSLMCQTARRGYLQLDNGKAMTAEILARLTGNSTDDASRWLQELEYSGVFSRTDDGTIFSRRLVREERELAQTRLRVQRHRGRNGDVTVLVTQVKQTGDLGLKEVDFDCSKVQLQPLEELGFELPDWVDKKAWNSYEEMRRKNRKPMTDAARHLAIGKLEKFRESGHEAKAVLEQSVLNSWQGLFEPKGEAGNGNKANQRERDARGVAARLALPSAKQAHR